MRRCLDAACGLHKTPLRVRGHSAGRGGLGPGELEEEGFHFTRGNTMFSSHVIYRNMLGAGSRDDPCRAVHHGPVQDEALIFMSNL